MRKYYHFENETALDRFKKVAKKVSYALLTVIVLYTTICIVFINTSRKLDAETSEHFFKRSPDLIAVFTGDSGRIKLALEKSKEYKQPNLFITGVYSKNTVKTILNSLGMKEENINTNHFELDYLAKNTLENVIFTHRYLQKRQDIKTILVVSHDYHIPRIRMIINDIQGEDAERKFYYAGVKTNYFKFRNIKLLYKEVFKWIRTYGFLILWDTEAELKDT